MNYIVKTTKNILTHRRNDATVIIVKLTIIIAGNESSNESSNETSQKNSNPERTCLRKGGYYEHNV